MAPNTTCNECGGTMQEGYILDLTQGGMFPSIWVEGKPENSSWSGLKTKGKTKYLISAYRCEKCGFLKFYAVFGRSDK